LPLLKPPLPFFFCPCSSPLCPSSFAPGPLSPSSFAPAQAPFTLLPRLPAPCSLGSLLPAFPYTEPARAFEPQPYSLFALQPFVFQVFTEQLSTGRILNNLTGKPGLNLRRA